MKVIEFIKGSGYEYHTKPTTSRQKAAEYIASRIDDYLSDAGEAKKLVNSKGAQNAIECEINSLVSLNSKICGMMSTKSAVLRT